MSWEDRTPFESIEYQFGLNHNQLEKFLKSYLKRSSYILWKKELDQDLPNIKIKD